MNTFLKKILRGKAFTVLTALLLAAATALISIGYTAWRGTSAQLEQVGELYTTIAIPHPESFSKSIFREDDAPDTMIPLTRQKRSYPGLLTEDLRGFLAAHVAGCGTLSCYEVGTYIPDYDAYGTAMAVVAAKCVSVWDRSMPIAHTTELEDGTAVDLQCTYTVDFSLEEIVCRHPAYSWLPEVKNIGFFSQIYTAEKRIPFEVGKTYLLFGVLNGPESYWRMNRQQEFQDPEYTTLDVDQFLDWGRATPRTGNMLFYWRDVSARSEEGGEERYRCLEEDSLPFYAEYTGDWRDFLNTEEGRVWRETVIPVCEMNYESAAVVLTDSVTSLLQFNTGAASLVEGRYFDGREYANGDSVCLASAAYAVKNGLSVGDIINLDFYRSELKYRPQTMTPEEQADPILIHGPCIPDNRIGVQKDYEIIGIYSAPEFAFGQNSFQGDTIFIPKNSVPNSSLYENPSRPLLYSIILENGRVEEFENYLASIDCAGMFEYFDQEYSVLRDTYAVIASNARRLLALGAAAFVLAAALFVFLNLRRMAPTAQGMRLMGVKSGRVWRELTAALAVLAGGSAVLGGLLGAALYGFVTGKALSNSITLRPEILALYAGAAAAVLIAVAALCALPAARRKLMQTPKAGKKK